MESSARSITTVMAAALVGTLVGGELASCPDAEGCYQAGPLAPSVECTADPKEVTCVLARAGELIEQTLAPIQEHPQGAASGAALGAALAGIVVAADSKRKKEEPSPRRRPGNYRV